MITESSTPLPLIRKLAARFPGVWASLDDLYTNVWLRDADYTPLCGLPIGAAYTLLVERYGLRGLKATEHAAELTACYLWRKHKIIYAFDEQLAAELLEQAKAYREEDALPVEAMLHPPYPCVYIKCPGALDEYVDGFFAWIEWDVNRKLYEFRTNFTLPDMSGTVTTQIELHKPTLAECIEATTAETNKYSDRHIAVPSLEEIGMLLGALNMYLYVCSAEADIAPNPEHAQITRRSAAIRDKYREIEVQDVGIRIGSVLRRAGQSRSAPSGTPSSQTGSKKRAHTRRGHWHHYWTGSKSKPDDRKLVLKWTHPMLVGGSAGSDTVTVHPVK